MKILMVCSEFAPLAKTGGLADAVTGLEQRARRARPRRARGAAALRAPHGHGRRRRWATRPRSIGTSRSRPPQLAATGSRAQRNRASTCSTSPSSRRDRSITATTATPRASSASRTPRSRSAPALGWQPDVVHCHDWHASLVPRAATRKLRRTAPTALTLHNIGYQGVFSDDAARRARLGELERSLRADALGGGTLNFLRAGPALGRRAHDREPHLRRPRSARPRSAWGSRTC